MINRLYLKHIQEYLPYTDFRSIRSWCRKRGVDVLVDEGSNMPYVIKDVFEKAYDEPAEMCLKKKSKESNADWITAHMRVSAEYQRALDEKHSKGNSKYQPNGHYEKAMLKNLTQITGEL